MMACLRAELLKHRKSWPMLIAILAPICQVGFIGALFWFSDAVVARFRPGHRFWLELNFAAWNLFVLPTLAAVLPAMSWGQDRDAFAIRHLLHQPVKKNHQYLAKLSCFFLLFFGSQLLLAAFVPLAGVALAQNGALKGLMGAFDTALFFKFSIFSLLASVPVASFHAWFSFRFPSPAVALGAALAGTWAAVKLAGVSWLVQFLPWGLSGFASAAFERASFALPWGNSFGALAVAAAFAAIGSLDFSKNAYPKSMERN
jgi:hypothetical protein